MLITVVVIGVAATAFNALVAQLASDRRTAYQERQSEALFQVRSAYLRHRLLHGVLPPPHSGGGHFNAVADPNDPLLVPLLEQAGLTARRINDDGSAHRLVRVVQCVPGLVQGVNLFAAGGPSVFVTYTHCEAHNTQCSFNEPCNSGLPGDSPAMTALNFAGWDTVGGDSAPLFFSDLAHGLQGLRQTAGRLTAIRARLRERFDSDRLAAAAADTSNFFPRPTGAGASDLSGADPAANQGCRDGWYNLAASNVDLLTRLGLTPLEHGVTVGGGRIEYCADFDPDGTSGPDTPPHYAALRIHRSVSTATAPDGATAANNAFLTI